MMYLPLFFARTGNKINTFAKLIFEQLLSFIKQLLYNYFDL